MTDIRPHQRRLRRCIASGATLALALTVVPLAAHAADKDKKPVENSCVTCHSKARFLVTNKKLYDYYQNWKGSIHAQEGVTCSDCHGGNPNAPDKKHAHAGQVLSAGNARSAVNYRNIPATCAKCHDKIYDKFRQSLHYRHLKAKGQERQGPNCVTCHGAMNTTVLNVNDVRKACARCHNRRTKNHPAIPGEAERVLGDFLSVHRYYRYIAVKGAPGQLKATFKVIDPMVKDLYAEWHTFDLKKVEAKTARLLNFLKEQREEIRKGDQKKPDKGQ